jgi:archaellum component FlaF (FlaF/FlaG flagellin family)
MEQALVALIIIAIMISGALTLVVSAISPVDDIANSWKQMSTKTNEMQRTEIAIIDAVVPEEQSGTLVELTVRNEGKVSLCDFDSWDMIVQYYSDNTTRSVAWLPYTASLEDNKWTVPSYPNGIYYNGSPETYEPNILNPGEDMKVQIQLDPPIGLNTTNWATISASNGVSTRTIFQREST